MTAKTDFLNGYTLFYEELPVPIVHVETAEPRKSAAIFREFVKWYKKFNEAETLKKEKPIEFKTTN